MSLNKEDLAAIQGVVQTTVQPMIDNLAQDTAAGSAEVHEKFDEVYKQFGEVHERIDGLTSEVHDLNERIDAKDGKLENTVQRVDKLEEHVGIT